MLVLQSRCHLQLLPPCRAYRGQHLRLVLRLATPRRTAERTVELHGRETLAAVRRLVLHSFQQDVQPLSRLQLSVDGVLLPDAAEHDACLDEIAAIQDGTVSQKSRCIMHLVRIRSLLGN